MNMPAAIAVEVASHVAVAAAAATSAPLLSEFLHGRVLLCACPCPWHGHHDPSGHGHLYAWPWPFLWLAMAVAVAVAVLVASHFYSHLSVDGIMLDYS